MGGADGQVSPGANRPLAFPRAAGDRLLKVFGAQPLSSSSSLLSKSPLIVNNTNINININTIINIIITTTLRVICTGGLNGLCTIVAVGGALMDLDTYTMDQAIFIIAEMVILIIIIIILKLGPHQVHIKRVGSWTLIPAQWTRPSSHHIAGNSHRHHFKDHHHV